MDRPNWVPTKRDFTRPLPSSVQARRGIVRLIYAVLLLAGICFAIGGILLLLNVTIVVPEDVELPNLLSIIGSLVLSAALVYLYYQQREILSADQKSMLSVNRFLSGDGDMIDILISNSGSGSVHALLLKVEVEYVDSNLKGGTKYLGLKSEDAGGEVRSFIEPYQPQTSYRKKVLVPMEFPDGNRFEIVPFHIAMSFADDYDTTKAQLTLSIYWEDSIKTEELEIFDKEFDVVRGQNFEDFIARFPEHSRGI